MTNTDVMVDLETMGNGANAAFVSIGAVAFAAAGAPDGETKRLLINVDLQTCLDIGLEMDASTVLWWLKGSDEARAALHTPTLEPVPVRQALTRLKAFIPDWRTTRVWSKGPSFDLTILSEAYRRTGNKWGLCSYTNERCVRTIYDLAGIDDRAPMAGVAHNALDDAAAQAALVQEAYHRLGLRK